MVWHKVPYPEQAEMMYGMSHFSLQMNYFPSWLHDKVAPTDTRRRPDQRGLTTPVLTSGLEFCDNLPNMLKYFPFICQANNQAMTGSNTMESRGDAGPGWARRGYICSILVWLAGWLD